MNHLATKTISQLRPFHTLARRGSLLGSVLGNVSRCIRRITRARFALYPILMLTSPSAFLGGACPIAWAEIAT